MAFDALIAVVAPYRLRCGWMRDTLGTKARALALTCCCWMFSASPGVGKELNAPGDTGDLASAKQAVHEARWSDAEQLARRYLLDHLASAEGHSLLAYALFREDRPKESLVEYTHAAQLQTPTATDLRYVALDYVLLSDYRDADTWMTKSVNWNATDGESWYALGRIKYTENRFDEAASSFQEAIKWLPRSVKAENNLGLAYEGLDRLDDAIAAYRQAIAWQQGDPHPSEQPLLNLGTLLLDRNQVEEALPLLVKAATLAPGDSKIHAVLGKLYSRRGDLKHAQTEFEQATVGDPNNAALRFQLGQVYRKEGETEKAKAELARAAQLDGTHSSDSH